MLSMALLSLPAFCQTLSRYSHGEPTAEEQYLLELANRARANPAAEGRRLAATTNAHERSAIEFFKVDLNRMKREFASYAPRPPLAMSPQLLGAARRHSADMARHHFQSHIGKDGSTAGNRAIDAGFTGITALNESIYSQWVPSVQFAHAGFLVDWGYGPGGVQQGLGHRDNIMNTRNTVFREAGMGVVARTGADAEKYGRLAVTQQFGNRLVPPLFLVGVAYHDANNNFICDPGEGLPGIHVRSSVGGRYAITSESGGYTIPFSTSHRGATVTFSGKALNGAQSFPFSLNGENTKVDLRMPPLAKPVLRLKVLDGVASERGKQAQGHAVFRIIRTGNLANSLTVNLQRPLQSGGNRATPDDYKLSAIAPAKMRSPGKKQAAFSVTIPSGKRHADVKLVAVKDRRKEPTEKVRLTLKAASRYTVSDLSGATISIKD